MGDRLTATCHFKIAKLCDFAVMFSNNSLYGSSSCHISFFFLGFAIRCVNTCYANVCIDYFNSIKTFPSRSLYIFVFLRASLIRKPINCANHLLYSEQT